MLFQVPLFLFQCCGSVFPLRLKCSVLAPVSLRPLLLNTQFALIGQLIHVRASNAYDSRAASLNQFALAELAVNMHICNYDIMNYGCSKCFENNKYVRLYLTMCPKLMHKKMTQNIYFSCKNASL